MARVTKVARIIRVVKAVRITRVATVAEKIRVAKTCHVSSQDIWKATIAWDAS